MKRFKQWWVVLALAVLLGTASSALAQEDNTYTVEPGDTLYSIAQRFGVTVDDIAFANGITNESLILAGQVLTIPGTGGGAGNTYTVQTGDTLFSIARSFGTTVAALDQANPAITDINQIVVGQTINIPGGSGGGAQEPAPGESTQYTVQAGDNLFRIALRFGTTVDAIAAENGITNVNTIVAGQVLTIPGAADDDTADDGTADDGTTDDGTADDGAADDGTTDDGTADDGTADDGTADDGTTDDGVADDGTADDGVADDGTTDDGTTDDGTADDGAMDDGATDDGTADGGAADDGAAGDGGEEGGEIDPTPPAEEDGEASAPAGAFNLFRDPGFEEGGSVWQPYACISSDCPDETSVVVFGATAERIANGGAAQQWNCAFSACTAGIYQTVETAPGMLCEISAQVMAWSSDKTLAVSDLSTAADRSSAIWLIKVDQGGREDPFARGMLSSAPFGYAVGIYDSYTTISYQFITAGSQVTVYFENVRTLPLRHNVSFIDEASIVCEKV